METSLSRQSIALVLSTKNNATTATYTRNTKEKQKKTALANETIYTLIWYAFYDLRSGNGVGPIPTAPEPTRGRLTTAGFMQGSLPGHDTAWLFISETGDRLRRVNCLVNCNHHVDQLSLWGP